MDAVKPSEASKTDDLSKQLLGAPYASLTPVQKSVIDLIEAAEPTAASGLTSDTRDIWQRMADGVARIGGSWMFIFSFMLGMAVWMGVNLLLMGKHLAAFDPYPFIFLNLVLSMLAALQAPVIMMSQNRQAAKDRQAAEHDYIVNLRAELEIMRLHDKLDRIRAEEIYDLVARNCTVVDELKQEITRLKRSNT